MSEKHENEQEILIEKTNGAGVLLGLIFGVLLTIGGCIAGGVLCAESFAVGISILIISIILMIVFSIMFAGLKVLHPNEAAVYTLFGKYYGTIKKAGFFFINPFAVCYNPSAVSDFETAMGMFGGTQKPAENEGARRTSSKKISTKTITMNNRKQKVNDALGNPIIIGTAVIWKVVNPTKAVFNVDDYNKFLSTQCDAVIRNNARLYPYDTMEDDTDEKTLRGSSQEIAESMKVELQKRVEDAGIEICEVRITDLAYSDEIAAAMLQRQQATAIIAARQKIVEGAVGMVKMAIDQLGEDEVVVLDEERKAAMVSNLLVVLCGNKEAQPVVNSSSIY
ncbi:MAG: SPFH domain-containing protein [Coprococcus sp.]